MSKIAIIGAGFTGLTAAYELTKLGHEVTVYEKGSDIGGLAGGFTIEGASLEKAYHHLFRTDTDILKLINELEMQNELNWLESKIGMAVRKYRNTEMQQSKNEAEEYTIYPFNGVKDLLLYKPLGFFDRLRAGIVLFYLQKYKNWKKFVSISAYDWMEKWAGPNVTREIWGPLLEGKFSRFSHKVSMAWLWARVHIRANSRKSIFEKELLAYPRYGFLSIANRIAEKTAELRKDKTSDFLKLNITLEEIAYKNNKVLIRQNGVTETFDAVLSTIPEKAFRSLVKTPQTNEIPAKPIDYLSAVILVFTSSQSLSPYYWHTITDVDAPFLVFLQHTNLVPSSWYNGQNVYYIGAYLPQDHDYLNPQKYSDEKIKQEWFGYLKKLFPQFDIEKISNINLFKFPFAQHVVDLDYESKIPPYKSSLPNTYMSNFAQIFPEDRGTNYAVREGKKIASLIHNDLLQ